MLKINNEVQYESKKPLKIVVAIFKTYHLVVPQNSCASSRRLLVLNTIISALACTRASTSSSSRAPRSGLRRLPRYTAGYANSCAKSYAP